MNVTCHNCRKAINIPDHKIPKDRDLSFKCPKCKDRILIPLVKAPQKSIEERGKKQALSFSLEDRLNAMICIENPEFRKKVYVVLQQMGFDTTAVTDTLTALNKMEYHIYHLVVLDDAFEQNMGFSSIMERMNTMDMYLRRRICLVLISREFNTNDNMAALHSSVNNILHIDDIPHVESFFSKVLTEHKNFYSVYNESLKLAGKA